MNGIGAPLQRLIRRRANERCEYCGLAHVGQEATFHIDHVIPKSTGGADGDANRAFACVSCSSRKAARLNAVDPQTGETVEIFSPRRDPWSTHFRWDGVRIIGQKTVGRARVETLRLNRPLVLAIRREQTVRGRHPPPVT